VKDQYMTKGDIAMRPALIGLLLLATGPLTLAEEPAAAPPSPSVSRNVGLVQAEDRPVRPAAARYRTVMNATVVAVEAEVGTLTVNGGAIGKEHTFTLAAEARQDARGLKPGDEVVIALGAADTGEETVTHVMRWAANGPSPGSTAQPDAPPTPAPSPQPTPQPTPPTSAPSGERRLPTDLVGPFRDPRVNPHFDPRVNPHRDPRVISGLTEPAPTPAPTPSPEEER
jgi:hypothetical protein